MDPNDRMRVQEAVERALNPAGHGDYDTEYRAIGLQDGVKRWIAAKGRAFFEGVGAARRAVRFTGTVMDITERKRAEEALRESEEFKARLIEGSRDCIKILDLDGRLLWMNARGIETLEICDFEHLLNSSWMNFWKGEDREAAHAAVAAARSGRVGRFTGFFPTARGKAMWWDVMVTAILNAERRPERLLSAPRSCS